LTVARLHERVAFDALVRGSDGYGGEKLGWADPAAAFKTVARFRYLRGGETVQAARLRGRQPVVATIRNCAAARAITTEHRMRDLVTGKEFNIRAIIETEDRRYLEITAESGVEV
jgi:head-tail adaptor